EAVAAEHEDVARAAELAGQPRALGHGAEGVLVELALVVEGVDEDVVGRHQISFLSSSQARILSTVSFVSSSSMIVPPAFCGGALKSPHWTAEPSAPTFEPSMPTSPVVLASSGFFLAPMIALSDG